MTEAVAGSPNMVGGMNTSFSGNLGFNTPEFHAFFEQEVKRKEAEIKKSKELADQAKKQQSEEQRREKLLRIAREARMKEIEDGEIKEYLDRKKELKEQRDREKELAKQQQELEEQKRKDLNDQKKVLETAPVAEPSLIPQPEETELPKNEEPKKEKSFIDKFGAFVDMLPKSVQKSKQQEDGEQKNLGEKVNRVSFNREGITILKDLILGAFPNATFKNIDKILKNQEDELEELKKLNKPKNTILELLKDIGIVAGLVGLFWKPIRDWLENKLGINLDFVDKFRGLFEGIGRFFIINPLGGSAIVKVAGKAFASFGEMLEGALKAVFSIFTGKTGAKAAEAGAEGLKGILPRLAGGLFRGLSKAAIKGIPVLGALYSFYLMVERFKDNDYLGAIIELAGGVGGILELSGVLAPVGLGLQYGALALVALTDWFGVTGKNSNKRIASSVGKFFSGIGNYLMKVPFVKFIVNSMTGLWDFYSGLLSGDEKLTVKGLENMKDLPFLGDAASTLLGFLGSDISTDKAGNKKFSGSAFETLKNTILKSMLSWLPDFIAKPLSEFLGLKDDRPALQQPPIPQIPKATKFEQKRLDALQRGAKNLENMLNDKSLSTEEKQQVQSALERANVEIHNYKALKPKVENDVNPDEKMQSPETSKKKESFFKDTQTENPQPKAYEVSPQTIQPIQNPSDKHVEKLIKAHQEHNERVLQKLDGMTKTVSEKASNPTVINNHTVTKKEESGGHMSNAQADINTDRRIAWWRASRELNPTF